MLLAVTAAAVMPTGVTLTVLVLAVVVTGVPITVVVLAVMVAGHLRVMLQRAGQEGFHSLVRVAAHAAIKGDSCLGKGSFCAAADTAANQSIYPAFF